MSPERRGAQSAITIDQLFSNFDRADKVRARERSADEIVRFAMEENYDWEIVISAIDKGLAAIRGVEGKGMEDDGF